MFHTVVIGVDGRDGGQDALALARTLAAPGGRLVAVHVFPYELDPSRGSLAGYENALREDATTALEGWVGDADVERRVVADVSAARALHHVARELDADLIVVGSAHRGAVGRVLLGDVSRSTLHGAECCVAVAPSGQRDADPLIGSVGAGYQRTPQGEAALGVATALARRLGAGLRLLTAVPVPVAFAPGYAYTFDWQAVVDANRRQAREDLEAVTAGLELSVASDVVDDPAGDALVALSQAVDLMVVGSRGWGTARSILLGSAGDRLVHHAHCPVIVVPRPGLAGD